jgi:acyl-homoserine-lactone acylase
MKKLLFALAFTIAGCTSPGLDEARWEARADNVTITRDEWGIAHVRGRTDADAVFGMIYAQAEDDFNRIEVNYLNAMGRLAEAEGEARSGGTSGCASSSTRTSCARSTPAALPG